LSYPDFDLRVGHFPFMSRLLRSRRDDAPRASLQISELTFPMHCIPSSRLKASGRLRGVHVAILWTTGLWTIARTNIVRKTIVRKNQFSQ
jgi:hypothetical protein